MRGKVKNVIIGALVAEALVYVLSEGSKGIILPLLRGNTGASKNIGESAQEASVVFTPAGTVPIEAIAGPSV